ncbi:MAG: toxin-activating lysine-acyltransferase [Hyphomicrobium sp.]|nr:toxin-activating lysine-acyltransferase [Hyphomicrobium sp.]
MFAVGTAQGSSEAARGTISGHPAEPGSVEPEAPTTTATPATGPLAATEAGGGIPPVSQPSSPPSTPHVSPQEIQFAVSFARILSVMSRTPHYRYNTIADLEWLVAAPVMLGQFAVMEAWAPHAQNRDGRTSDAQHNDAQRQDTHHQDAQRQEGRQKTVAVALWAFVSPDVDQRLSQNLDAPIRLAPHEWRSGDTLWLVDAIGDARALPQLLASLQQTAFKGRDAKMRTVSATGARAVQTLRAVM